MGRHRFELRTGDNTRGGGRPERNIEKSRNAGDGHGCGRLRNFQQNCGRLDPPKSGNLTPLHDSRYTCKPIKDFDFER